MGGTVEGVEVERGGELALMRAAIASTFDFLGARLPLEGSAVDGAFPLLVSATVLEGGGLRGGDLARGIAPGAGNCKEVVNVATVCGSELVGSQFRTPGRLPLRLPRSLLAPAGLECMRK